MENLVSKPVVNINLEAGNVPSTLGISEERADELTEKSIKAFADAKTQMEHYKYALEECESLEEVVYTIHSCANIFQRLNGESTSRDPKRKLLELLLSR